MISDAYCRVTCDRCHYEEEVELTALAQRESYDMRNVRRELERNNWRVDGDETICEDCVAQETGDE